MIKNKLSDVRTALLERLTTLYDRFTNVFFTTTLKGILFIKPILIMAKRTKQETEKLKELAEMIYLSDYSLNQKEVAEKVGVTEKTLSSWIEAGKWKDKRNSLLTTKKNQINEYHAQLNRLNDEIKTRKIIYDVPLHLIKPIKMKDSDGADYLHYQEFVETDYPVKIGNTPTTQEADTIVKITNSIKKLETELGLGEVIQCGLDFMAFVKPHDLDFAKKFNGFYDSFIKTKLK